MSGEKQGYLRIFLGSPSDVESERGIIYKVIDEVDNIFEILESNNVSSVSIRHLRAIGWEQVPPGVGLPNRIILNKLQVEESDIAIFVFWKRFGTSPGTRRPDGKKYSSGTEEEFDRVFTHYRQSGNSRPIIMVYRKKDEFSLLNANIKEVKQYEKVLKFFQECESEGKYPVLYHEFKANEFERDLRKHLIDVVFSLLKGQENGTEYTLPKNKAAEPEVSLQEDQFVSEWMERSNLLDNPFRYRLAEDEVDLLRYYVRFKELKRTNADNIIQDKNNWLIFGREGSGKTALRKFLKSKCEGNPNILCIEYEKEKFTEALASSEDIDQIVLTVVRQLCDLALDAKDIHKRTNLGIYNAADPSLVLIRLKEELSRLNIGRIIFLIDPISESMLIQKDTAKISTTLARLAAISLSGIGLRFFFPKSIQANLYNKQHAYVGRCTPIEIKWDQEELLSLIRQRMIYYSKDKINANNSLGLLGQPSSGMERIDHKIINLSENNPRAIIWLANQLISKHCQSETIPLKIQPQSWDKVQHEWGAWGRNYILGSLGQEDGFWLLGNDIYFKDMRLNLSKRSKTLLGVLIEAEGQLCTKEKLIEIGWENENKDGVTEAALREAMRRLKNELQKKQNWLKTIHGQGYRLQNPNEAEA